MIIASPHVEVHFHQERLFLTHSCEVCGWLTVEYIAWRQRPTSRWVSNYGRADNSAVMIATHECQVK